MGVSRSHSFVPGQTNYEPPEEEIIQATPKFENEESGHQEQPLTPRSFVGSPSIPDSSVKKVSKRILIELMKGEWRNFLNFAESFILPCSTGQSLQTRTICDRGGWGGGEGRLGCWF